jgi:C4-dicarboxylate-specific signal transduction histidine kinase
MAATELPDDGALRRERLATLGMLAAGTAHDLNNTVGYIAANLRHLDAMVPSLLDLTARAEALLKRATPPSDAERDAWCASLKDLQWVFLQEDLPNLLRDTAVGAEQLTRTLAGLKRFARGGDERELLSLDECVGAACLLLGWHLRHGVHLDQHLAAPGHLSLTRTGVVQSVVNLLHNGIEAQGGQGRLRIETCHEAGGVLVAVEDDGPGVPENLRERIFEAFHSTKAQGTGLGLSIVQRVAADHGGSVRCLTARHLSGARFELRLAAL